MPRASIQTASRLAAAHPPSRVVQAVLRQPPLVFLGQRLQQHSSATAGSEFLAQQNGERTLLIAFHIQVLAILVLADLFWSVSHGRTAHPPAGCRFGFFTTVESRVGGVGWLLQRRHRLHRGRLDRPALNQAREALAQGRQALVVAPEGHQQPLGRWRPWNWCGPARLLGRRGHGQEPGPAIAACGPVGIRYSWRRPN